MLNETFSVIFKYCEYICFSLIDFWQKKRKKNWTIVKTSVIFDVVEKIAFVTHFFTQCYLLFTGSIPQQQLSSFDDDVKCLLRKKIFLFEYSILHTDGDPYLDAELMKTSSFLFLL